MNIHSGVNSSGMDAMNVSAADKAASEVCKEAGNEYTRQKKYAKAIKEYKAGLEFDPTNSKIWSNLALCYEHIGDLTQWKEAAQRTVQADASWFKGYARLASAQRRLWEFNDAKVTLETGLSINPKNSDLQGLRSKIDHEIMERAQFSSELLQIPDNGYDLFGGLKQPNQRNQIPPDSFYASLPRPGRSPYMRKMWKLTRAGIDDVTKENHDLDMIAANVIDVFCNQDLLLKWRSGEEGFQLEGYIPDDDVHPVIVFIDEIHPLCHGMGTHVEKTTTMQNPLYESSLTDDQREILKILLITRFLRSIGSVLQESHFLVCCSSLKSLMLKKEYFKDVADLDLIRCDVLCNCRSIDTLSLEALGVSLESAKRFKSAGEIYREVAERKFDCAGIQYPDRHFDERFHGYSGLAFKRGMNYIDAEIEYLASLRLAVGRNWNLTDGGDGSDDVSGNRYRNLRNTVLFYQMACSAFAEGFKNDITHSKMPQVHTLLLALLSISANRVVEDIHNLMYNHAENLPKCKSLLRSKYKTPTAAENLVKRAFATQTVDGFHTVLFASRIPGKRVDISYRHSGLSAEDFAQREKQRSKDMSRNLLKQSVDTKSLTGGLSVCVQCNKRSPKMSCCPCQRAKYCSRECQVAHYPIHKHNCSLYKKGSK